jgi:hypothetical protein
VSDKAMLHKPGGGRGPRAVRSCSVTVRVRAPPATGCSDRPRRDRELKAAANSRHWLIKTEKAT